MTRFAVHWDRVLAVGGGHLVVVAPHAPREIIVSDMVWMGFPVGVHGGEDRFAVGLCGKVGSPGNEFCFFSGDFRVVRVVKVGERSAHSSHPRRVAFVLALDRLDRLFLEIGEGPELGVGIDDPVNSLGWNEEGVGGTVVAIDAVHDSGFGIDFCGRMLLAVAGVCAYRAVGSRELNPGDLFAPLVRRDITDLVIGIDVPPVNPTSAANVETTATGTEQHRGVGGAVGFVGLVAREYPQLVAVMFVGPMTLLAGLTCRTQSVDGGADRTSVGVDRGAPYLAQAVEL